MLTQLRFKNWRSLRDVTIENLQPINVFIGVNASGKTNILDALYFLRDANIDGSGGVVGNLMKRGGFSHIRTHHVPESLVELEFTFKLHHGNSTIRYGNQIDFINGDEFPLIFSTHIEENNQLIYANNALPLPFESNMESRWQNTTGNERGDMLRYYAHLYESRRWQMLDEGFVPPLKETQDNDNLILNLISSTGRNVPFILNLMQQTRFDLFTGLSRDLQWLLGNVYDLEIEAHHQQTKIKLNEKNQRILEMPTVSFGTRRLLAILTAMYLLDMDLSPFKLPYRDDMPFADLSHVPVAHMPGLLVIEEPDMALNPGLLRKFVEKLREFVANQHPRQLILTTHNPTFLDYFTPEEIRIVDRDADGYTVVKPISRRIRELWFDDEETPHLPGQAWLNNMFGALAE
jgi:predicted ATPase